MTFPEGGTVKLQYQSHLVRKPFAFATGSPIEAMMLCGLFDEMETREWSWHWVAAEPSRATLTYIKRPGSPLIEVCAQAPVGKYRCDFVLTHAGKRVAIECDGHEFHERTKEQAEHDKRRDRFFVSHGLVTLRFTGREIHRSASDCAAEALNILAETKP